jgi:hypothetical protein
LETFIQAIELLAEQRQPWEVGLIGVGQGDTSFGAHILASFPTDDPRKGKRIAWAEIGRRPGGTGRVIALARLARNECIQADIIYDHVLPVTPSDCAAWKELERNRHKIAGLAPACCRSVQPRASHRLSLSCE